MTDIKARLIKLENRFLKTPTPPGLIYCESEQSFEEAKKDYEKCHGFELPENAFVLEIVRAEAKHA